VYSVPVDDDEGYATTDDDLDFDMEEDVSSAPTRTAPVPVAQQAKNAVAGAVAGAAGRNKVIRKNVEASFVSLRWIFFSLGAWGLFLRAKLLGFWSSGGR
jgi:hypothetical protein